MITLYGIPRSRSLRVSWLLEELGLDWNYHYIDFAKGDNRSPEYLALNPSGKVPALTDEDIVITESAAILLYLAERYGEGKWLPAPGTADAALHHKWVSFIISELEQPLWTMGKHKFALPEKHRHREILAVAKWEFDRAAKIAEAWLPSQGFLMGNEASVADILLCHTLIWATRFEQSLSPRLEEYMVKVSGRPAMKRALDKELAGAEAR